MKDNVKTVGEFEKEKGLVLLNVNPNEKISEAEFDAVERSKKTGVDHPKRIEFLKANGYEVTRENMVDVSLSAREK